MNFKEAKKQVNKKLQEEAEKYADAIKTDFKLATEQNSPLSLTAVIKFKSTIFKYDFLNNLLDTIVKLESLNSISFTSCWKIKGQIHQKNVSIVPYRQLDWQEKTDCSYDDMKKLANYIFQDKKDDFYIHLSNIIHNKRLSERLTRNIFGTAPKHQA